ncbi:MAG: hypothetical protein Phyf2KO_12870 [Phycisphaerales bacterium]
MDENCRWDLLVNQADRFVDRKCGLLSLCDNTKKWIVTIWFAAIGIGLGNNDDSSTALTLLIPAILIFYILDVLFRSQVLVYTERILFADKYLMSIKKEDLSTSHPTLRCMLPKTTLKLELRSIVRAAVSRYTLVFYSIMVAATLILKWFVF